MKKAVLLLGMVTLMAGCIYLKNADMNTVLYHQRMQKEVQSVSEYQVEYTEDNSDIRHIEERKQETKEETQEKITGVIYERMSQDEQKIYVEILDSLLSYEDGTKITTTDSELIDKAFNCVMLDHPELFYVDGYKYTEYASGGTIDQIVFTGKYLYNKEEMIRRRNIIDKKVQSILSKVPDTDDEYKKVKYIYDVLVQQTEYDVQASDNQNICSVFLNGKSVCQGYAKALQYLLNQLEMKCSLVLGTVKNGEGHAWNLVSVNGEWYYLDVTWGDAFYLFGEQEPYQVPDSQLINYDYLCVTTQQMMLTHTPDMPVELPDCISVADNYYVREGLYFTAYEEDKLAGVFRKAEETGRGMVTVKCSNETVYDEMYRVLLEEQKIFDFVSLEDTIAYTDSREQGSLTFWLFEGRY